MRAGRIIGLAAALLGAGIAAITFNLIVTYWLARRWLRPVLSRLVARLGHRLPEVEGGDAEDAARGGFEAGDLAEERGGGEIEAAAPFGLAESM